MEDLDGPGEAGLSGITGDNQSAGNRSRQWFQYASVTGWESAQEILTKLSDAHDNQKGTACAVIKTVHGWRLSRPLGMAGNVTITAFNMSCESASFATAPA